jgi:FixJ family two-component response regulator
MAPEPTVYVVDDSSAVRKSLHALLTAAGLTVETYASGEDFLGAFDPARPGCLVLDIRLRGASGLAVQETLAAGKPTIPIIIITGYGDVPVAVRAMKKGAIDVLRKPFAPHELLDRIKEAVELDRRSREVEAQRTVLTARLARLTAREREVLDLLASGRTTKEIAGALSVSMRTVDAHRCQVLMKMEVHSVTSLLHLLLSAPALVEPAHSHPA